MVRAFDDISERYMSNMTDPVAYEAWYHTRRGRWIADHEFSLLQRLLNPALNTTLLDVGCGTGYFTRRFSRLGLSVTGIDPDENALDYARQQNSNITYLQGSALNLPFQANSYDYTSAITSLCFITDPVQALQEMWRVSRHGMVLGLLNRHSILHRMKQGKRLINPVLPSPRSDCSHFAPLFTKTERYHASRYPTDREAAALA